VERVEGGCPRGGEEEGGGGGQRGGKGWGRLQQLGEGEGSARVGKEGAPIHRIKIKGPNTLSYLSSRPQRKKMPKDLLFP
jgi:hypothetical protein